MSRTKTEPTLVQTDRFDDTQSIGSVSQMYDKFVRPIDRDFRSIANSPGLGSASNTTRNSGDNQLEAGAKMFISGQSVDATNGFVESRCHAFYRMLGLPVVSQDGFYNSGHDPDHGSSLSTRTTINDSLSNKNPDVLTLASLRESSALDRRRIFSVQDDVATGYSLLLRNPKRFLVAETGKDPFYFDKQTQPVAGRKEDIQNLVTSTDIKNTLTRVAESPSHIIKPFIVVPAIEGAVTPEHKRRVCVPFLENVAATRTTTETLLKRPIIEYIVRQRLTAREQDRVFLETANRLINNTTDTSDASAASIRNALLAIGGETSVAELNQDVLDGIDGFTTIQTSTVIMFTRAIQVCIEELAKNIRKFNEVSAIYNIQPVPSRFGPEYGGTIKTIGGVKQRSQADQKIATMELNRLLSYVNSSSEDSIIGDSSVFASAVIADLNKNFDKPIKKLKSERDRAGAIVINNLKNIEIISGEISGFGLVDILALYTALWTIDIGDLLGLLDNNSLARLTEHFGYLAPPGSEARIQLSAANRSTNIFEVLRRLEVRIFNILTYADGILVKTRQGPRRARKGTI